MDLKHAFNILGVDETTPFSEIKRAYRELASIWHPDRHSNNPRLAKKALQKMKDLNAAYDLLSAYYKARSTTTSNESYSYDAEDVTVVRCKNCGTLNRIQNIAGVTFKCGKCKNDLFADQSFNDDSERILCGDEECIGIIQNGRCIICGKTLEEGKRENQIKTRLRQQQWSEKQKVENKRRKKKTFFNYSVIVAFVILSIYAIYQENLSTDIKRTSRASQPSSTEDIFLKKSTSENTYRISKVDFEKKPYRKKDLIELQLNLKSLGYKIGPIDGIIGPRTINACNKFIADFCIFSRVNAIESLINDLRVHVAVTAVYPEWPDIVRLNLLDHWVMRQPVEVKKQILWALRSNNPKFITIALNLYTFETKKPPELPTPRSGVLWKSFAMGVAPLKISTRNKNQNYFIKIVDSHTNREILKGFLRGGDTIELHIPLGVYIIKCAAGEKWYGERFFFGPYTAFGKLDKVFEFERIGSQVSGYSIELYLQPYGNLHMTKLSVFQF